MENIEELQESLNKFKELQEQDRYRYLMDLTNAVYNCYEMAKPIEKEFERKLLFMGSFIMTGFCNDYLFERLDDWANTELTLEDLLLICNYNLPVTKKINEWSDEEKSNLKMVVKTHEEVYKLLVTLTSGYYKKNFFDLNKTIAVVGGNPFALSSVNIVGFDFLLYDNHFVAWDLENIMAIHNRLKDTTEIDLEMNKTRLTSEAKGYINAFKECRTEEEFVAKVSNVKLNKVYIN